MYISRLIWQVGYLVALHNQLIKKNVIVKKPLRIWEAALSGSTSILVPVPVWDGIGLVENNYSEQGPI